MLAIDGCRNNLPGCAKALYIYILLLVSKSFSKYVLH